MKRLDLDFIYEREGLNSISGMECGFSLAELEAHFKKHDILPPRTGHIGDWESFSCYSGTALDFNAIILEHKLGAPLLVGTTRTEDLISKSGDLVYRPGTILELDKIQTLDLRRFADESWLPVSDSVYSPITAVAIDNKLQSLAEFHSERSAFPLEAHFLLAHQPDIIEIVESLIDLAFVEKNPRRILSNVFSHWLNRDGRIERIQRFEMTKEDAKRAFVPIRTQVDSHFLIHEYPHLTGPFPLFCGLFIFFLEALLQVDRKTINNSTPVHFHWGARGMAGFPPHREGYFFSTSTQRRLRTLFRAMQEIRPDFKKLTIVMLPAPIFLLLQLERDNAQRYWPRISELSFYDSKNRDRSGWVWEEKFSNSPISDLTTQMSEQFLRAQGGMR